MVNGNGQILEWPNNMLFSLQNEMRIQESWENNGKNN